MKEEALGEGPGPVKRVKPAADDEHDEEETDQADGLEVRETEALARVVRATCLLAPELLKHVVSFIVTKPPF